MEVLYTLLTRHPLTGTGYPVAFMVTNDQTVGPINQWLVHLRDACNLSATFITIDCCIAEVNAIKAALPNTGIHYCAFHVMKAWKSKVGDKVSLDASFTKKQLGEYKTDLIKDLKGILVERDEAEFTRKIAEFKAKIATAQPTFLKYFKKYWVGTDELLGRWGKPHVAESHLRYLTNNYIESWHNQLKTVYFGRARNRRLDRLVFILTGDVEFYFEEEVERIALQNGKMSPLERELSIRSYTANQVPNMSLPLMITHPANDNPSSPENINNGIWKISSFNEANSSDVAYTVLIQNSLIVNCSCPDFTRRQAPCKHMYLLKRYTSVDLSFLVQRSQLFANDSEDFFFDDDADFGGDDLDIEFEENEDVGEDIESSGQEINVEETIADEIEEEEIDVEEIEDQEIKTSESENIDILYQSILSKITNVYHQKKDYEKLRQHHKTENVQRLQEIDSSLNDIISTFDALRDQNKTLFRDLNRQQN